MERLKELAYDALEAVYAYRAAAALAVALPVVSLLSIDNHQLREENAAAGLTVAQELVSIGAQCTSYRVYGHGFRPFLDPASNGFIVVSFIDGISCDGDIVQNGVTMQFVGKRLFDWSRMVGATQHQDWAEAARRPLVGSQMFQAPQTPARPSSPLLGGGPGVGVASLIFPSTTK